MTNKFKVKFKLVQISTNQYVLRRQIGHVKEHLDTYLNVVRVASNIYNNVVFTSHSSALNSLKEYSNK
jgi:hypothetical protein